MTNKAPGHITNALLEKAIERLNAGGYDKNDCKRAQELLQVHIEANPKLFELARLFAEEAGISEKDIPAFCMCCMYEQFLENVSQMIENLKSLEDML